MFTIDLLKGQGVPIKTGPEGLAIITATFAVPIIVAIVMFGCYLNNGIIISIQRQEIVNYQEKIDELSDAVTLQKSFEKEKVVYSQSLSEVKSSIGRHTQWSPVLVALVKNMPDSVVLTQLATKQHSVKRKAPGKDGRQIDIMVPVRTLQISISGSPYSACETAVRDFRQRLHTSDLLAPKLQDIRVSQGVDRLDGADVVSYEIDCLFKPGL